MKDIIIIGGGLAGLIAANHLALEGFEVLLIEKKRLPQHKVCGEYISAEIIPYLHTLQLPLFHIQSNTVTRFRLHAPSGRFIESPLPLGGLGIRRYTLDYYLYEQAKRRGVQFELETQVNQVDFVDPHFNVVSKTGIQYQAKVLLGAFGKRSNLDKKLERPFITKQSSYFGVKFYLKSDFPKDLVALYHFEGGYAGAVQVEDQSIDIAYLSSKEQLQKYGNIAALEEELLYKNPAIKALFSSGNRLSDKAFTISNVSFLSKAQVYQHMLMIGDAAGMIPPIAGNGMAMGVHAAKLASEWSIRFLMGKISRNEMEMSFQKEWQQAFARRLFWGRRLHSLMKKAAFSEFAVRSLKQLPFLLPPIIKKTHGTPII